MIFLKKISPKVVAFLIIVYLSFTFTGCPSKLAEEVVEETTEEIVTTEETEPTIEEETEEKKEEKEEPQQIPEPEPITLKGTGDSIVDIDKPDIAMVVYIQGNAGSRYFGVTSYDKDGNRIDLLVNTSEPYDGIRPIDFRKGEWTSRFEIKAIGDWTIEVLPILPEHIRALSVPGTIEGKDDEVFVLTGDTPDLANITGNAEGRYFGVFTYNGGRDLLVNTSEPYKGTVMLNQKAFMIEVIAVGSWKIEITSK